jgi:hypothetical protein
LQNQKGCAIFGSATKIVTIATRKYHQTERRTKMSDESKKILTSLTDALSQANESQRDYLMGYAEGIIQSNIKREQKSKHKKKK